jgi:hypothetical protein
MLSSHVPIEIFFFRETQKRATNSGEIFIIFRFTANSENQWVVFIRRIEVFTEQRTIRRVS